MVVKRFLNAGMSMEEVSVKRDASVEDLTNFWFAESERQGGMIHYELYES